MPNRWTQYDEDSYVLFLHSTMCSTSPFFFLRRYRLPEGFRRIGYDADSSRYTFMNDLDGRIYQSEPGSEYGILTPVGPAAPQSIPSRRKKPDLSLDKPPTTFSEILSSLPPSATRQESSASRSTKSSSPHRRAFSLRSPGSEKPISVNSSSPQKRAFSIRRSEKEPATSQSSFKSSLSSTSEKSATLALALRSPAAVTKGSEPKQVPTAAKSSSSPAASPTTRSGPRSTGPALTSQSLTTGTKGSEKGPSPSTFKSSTSPVPQMSATLARALRPPTPETKTSENENHSTAQRSPSTPRKSATMTSPTALTAGRALASPSSETKPGHQKSSTVSEPSTSAGLRSSRRPDEEQSTSPKLDKVALALMALRRRFGTSDSKERI
ncbi:hypothetical protein C8J56DRAFT_926181 [Mycena floridula]|nr:hypothetical protein C8J56DRAFT_926181 [Mycena floridula]